MAVTVTGDGGLILETAAFLAAIRLLLGFVDTAVVVVVVGLHCLIAAGTVVVVLLKAIRLLTGWYMFMALLDDDASLVAEVDVMIVRVVAVVGTSWWLESNA